MSTVLITVPASTSNLGPGFDTLGMALRWRMKVSASSSGSLEIDCPGLESFSAVIEAMSEECLEVWAAKSGRAKPRLNLCLSECVPFARGLGSSACLRLAVLCAANTLGGEPLSGENLLALACGLERHTDNAVPCLHGGLTVSGFAGEGIRWARFQVPASLRFAVLVPERTVMTSAARDILPHSVTRQDAVGNMQRVGWLLHAVSTGQTGLLKGVFKDSLHQPYRSALMPYLDSVIEAAEKAGALGAFLSGSGSTVIAVTGEKEADRVGEAMLETLRAHGDEGSMRVLGADNNGLTVESR